MAFYNINDINFQISSWIADFELFTNLSILDESIDYTSDNGYVQQIGFRI